MADGTLIFDTKLNADNLKKGLSSMGSLALKGAAAVGAGALAAAGAAGALVKASVEGYAELEQLVGGVETLFGESADIVQQYAENAYKNAGMSANEYMSTITGFSASLIQSLGGDTKAAAEVGNKAIEDMSDNANKMGTSMELIQNAYQGFAKQNYTMLDNLKLGYGGTKEEMERLLADASAIAGVEFSIDSYADIIEAIHVIQENMGIAGATASEAATTIEGSFNTTKAAWSNLVTGMSDENADLDGLITDFVDSVSVLGENLLPVIETAIGGMATLLEQLLPQVAEKIPTIIMNILPGLLETGAQIIVTLLEGIISMLPSLVTTATQILLTLLTTLISMLPQILQCGIDCILNLALGIAQALPTLVPTVVDVILALVETLIDNIDLVIDAAIQLIMGLAEGIIQALPILIQKAPTIIEKLLYAIIRNAPKLVKAAFEMLNQLEKGILDNIPKLVAQMPKLIDTLFKALLGAVGAIVKIGYHIVEGIWTGISGRVSWLLGKVAGFAQSIINKVKEVLDIHSPSKKFAWVGRMCIEGFDQEFENYDPYGTLDDSLSKSMRAHKGTLSMSYGATVEQRNGNDIDYDRLGQATVKAFIDANVQMKVDGRPFGRLIGGYA